MFVLHPHWVFLSVLKFYVGLCFHYVWRRCGIYNLRSFNTWKHQRRKMWASQRRSWYINAALISRQQPHFYSARYLPTGMYFCDHKYSFIRNLLIYTAILARTIVSYLSRRCNFCLLFLIPNHTYHTLPFQQKQTCNSFWWKNLAIGC